MYAWAATNHAIELSYDSSTCWCCCCCYMPVRHSNCAAVAVGETKQRRQWQALPGYKQTWNLADSGNNSAYIRRTLSTCDPETSYSVITVSAKRMQAAGTVSAKRKRWYRTCGRCCS